MTQEYEKRLFFLTNQVWEALIHENYVMVDRLLPVLLGYIKALEVEKK